MIWQWSLASYALGAYIFDVLYRPFVIAKAARQAANKRNKPLLNIGAGTPHSSLRSLIIGPTLWGDVNLDIAAGKEIPHGEGKVSYGDIHKLPFKDKEFGAVIASHVLEHVVDPVAALKELTRIADEIFVITPLWWCPHTWAHPGHKWYVSEDGTCFPLWNNASAKVVLPARQVRSEH